MAFGDKLNWNKTDVDILLPIPSIESGLHHQVIGRGFRALPMKRCCDEPDNMAVEDNGDCICLKCRRVVGVEHFNRVLGC